MGHFSALGLLASPGTASGPAQRKAKGFSPGTPRGSHFLGQNPGKATHRKGEGLQEHSKQAATKTRRGKLQVSIALQLLCCQGWQRGRWAEQPGCPLQRAQLCSRLQENGWVWEMRRWERFVQWVCPAGMWPSMGPAGNDHILEQLITAAAWEGPLCSGLAISQPVTTASTKSHRGLILSE